MVANTLKELRKKSNLTQQQLATQLGVSKVIVSNWERGVTSIPIDYALPLSSILHCTPANFLAIHKNSIQELMRKYNTDIDFLAFANTNPDATEMLIWLIKIWDGNMGDFNNLITMMLFYSLLDYDDRSHLAYLIGVTFRRKYEYANDNTEIIKLALSKIPQYIIGWNELNAKADELRKNKHNIT